ncbi:MAG: OadG family protein [Clostridiales bacterium]|nr:OadG family protein [Clostridiales bacterium]
MSEAVVKMLFAGRAAESGYYAVIGLAVVFFVLAVIWGILELTGFLFRKKNTGVQTAPAEVSRPLPDPAKDEETVAAITAAVAMILAEESKTAGGDEKTPKFRVVAFRRTGGRN